MSESRKIASPVHRIVAFLIDWTISILPVIWLANWLSTSSNLMLLLSHIPTVIFFLVLAPIVFVLINSFMISTFGGTIGKLLTGTRIVTADGDKISFWKAFLRNHIGYAISGVFLWLGFIWTFVDKERRSWHDQIADTYVVVQNNWFVIIGAISLAVLIFVEFGMIGMSIFNFKSNGTVYTDVFNEIQSSLKSK